MRTRARPSYTSGVSIASRVVPGRASTITRSSPRSALTSEDLPTFGRPRNATRSGSAASASAPGGAPTLGRTATISSRSSPTPRPWVAEAERVELVGLGSLGGGIDLVRHEQHRPAPRAEQPGDLPVLRGEPRARVDHEQHDVGLVDRPLRLPADQAGERLAGARHQPAGVDERELPARPLARRFEPVAGDARGVLDDRGPPRDQAVEERGLADVGPSDDRDDRASPAAHRLTAALRRRLRGGLSSRRAPAGGGGSP